MYLDPKKPVENIDDILKNIYDDFFEDGPTTSNDPPAFSASYL